MTGMYASTAILAALAHRDRTGEGQHIDACLLDSAVAMMAVMNMNYLVTGMVPGRAGNAHQNIVPYQVFACADGHLILAVGNDGQFARFCEAAGRDEWARDTRFATNAARVRHRDVLVPMIAQVIATRSQHDWLRSLESRGVPCGPINRLDQVFADPQVRAREMRRELSHPLAGHAHEAAHALDDEVVAGTVRVRAVLAESGDRRVDQARIDRPDRIVMQPVAGQSPDLEVLDQHVGGAGEVAHDRLALRPCEIDRH
jgi:formyl-CoA transferase